MTANNASTPLLNRLVPLSKIKIKQKKEMLEIFTGFETNNRYEIYDPNSNQMIYFAGEETDCCLRYWCGSARPFSIHITDNNGVEVLRIIRPMKCRMGPCCSCIDCCQEELTVECPPGNVIGTVHQNYGYCYLSLDILDARGNKVLEVTRPGPCGHCMCTSICCCWHQDIELPIMTANGEAQIGKLSRDFAGWCKELFTDADTFSLEFPVDLQVEVKAILLGVAFMVDFMYFEKSQNDKADHS